MRIFIYPTIENRGRTWVETDEISYIPICKTFETSDNIISYQVEHWDYVSMTPNRIDLYDDQRIGFPKWKPMKS